MSEKSKKVFMSKMLSIFLASMFLLSACNTILTPTNEPTSLPVPSANSEPMDTATPVELADTDTPPTETMEPTVEKAMEFSMNLNNQAERFQSEIIPAVSASENPPYWLLMPEYTQISLEGYPVNQHRMQAKIYIYPVEELVATNEGTGKVVETLQTLIQNPREIKDMPFLPLMNEVQVMHTQIQYLEFKTGQGLRYLTEFGQGLYHSTIMSFFTPFRV
ncbi:MAG: hypothetical protein HGB14_04160 [Anaerolineaceae bacterium]|nr:hypothetical protein [Anaerolineaceae bacterium]